VKRKLKQYWSTIPPISTKQTTTSQYKKQHMELEMSGPGLGQAHKCGGLNPP